MTAPLRFLLAAGAASSLLAGCGMAQSAASFSPSSSAGEQVVALAYPGRRDVHFRRLRDFLGGPHPGGIYNVQWDGRFWALPYGNDILRLRIGGGTETVSKSTVHLNGNSEGESRFWIASGRVVAAQPSSLFYWKYPAGGPR